MKGRIAGIALVAAFVSAPALAQERLSGPGGVSIERPAGWSVIPVLPRVERLRGVRYDNPEFRSTVEMGGMSVLTLTKYPAGHAGINPLIEVRYEGLSGAWDPVGFLTNVVGGARRRYPDLEILDPIATVNFVGIGAHVRLAYVARDSGKPREMISESWVAVCGNYALVIGARYDRDAPAQTIVEIDRAVRSFRIDQSGPPPAIYAPSQ